MSTVIIGLSGKKQSGKTVSCESLINYISENFEVPNGIQTFSFADPLKQKVCIDILGLSNEQCNGTNEQKNSFTPYKWENLSEEIRVRNKIGYYASRSRFPLLPTGYMTAREIMQVVGTDIFRHCFDEDVWVNATFREISKTKLDVAIISDVRFPSEVEGVLKNGGILFRLLRDVCEGDSHESETALDDYDFYVHDENKVCVIDNQNMTISQKDFILHSKIEIMLGERLRRRLHVS